MKGFARSATASALMLSFAGLVHAAGFKQTIELFHQAGESGSFFDKSYGYAVFPNVGSGAVGVGGAYGTGRVYVGGKPVGTVVLKQVSVGFQLGGKVYSEIIFFQDERALADFQSGKIEFGADASAIAVTSAAHAQVGTNGIGTGMSEGQHDAVTQGRFEVGMAVFIIAKGGLMASASLAGQTFTFKPLAPQSSTK